jgi:opacity protein-like surface antigen
MISRILLVGAFAAAIVSAAFADETQAPATLSNEQAQARQLGIYFGGMASQYDLCVRKGFLAKGGQSAEEIAKSVLEKVRTLSKGPDQSAYVQDGWDTMKKEISEHESFYTKEKCSSVGKEWAKMVANLAKK